MTQVQQPTREPEPMRVNVRKCLAEEHQPLIAVMARAFDDDPIANWFAAQDAKRARRIHDFIAVMAQITSRHDEIYTTDGVQGGACWAPPGKWKMGLMQQLALLPAMVRTATLRRVPAIMGGLAAIEKKHPHAPH